MKLSSYQDDQEVFRVDSYPEGKVEERGKSVQSDELTEEAQVVIEQMVRKIWIIFGLGRLNESRK